MKHNKYLGYNVLISNFTGNASTAIVPFIQRSSVSRMFDSIRNEYDSTTMNLFTETNYLSRVFLQFISLVLRVGVLNVMNTKKLNRTMTFKEVVMEISNLRTVKIPGVKRPQNTFATDEQLRILRAFDVPIDDEK